MDADGMVRQQRRYGIDDGDGRRQRDQRRRPTLRADGSGVDQQAEGQGVGAGPPAIRAPPSPGRLSVGDDQEGKLTIALCRALGRTVIGRPDVGKVLHTGNKGLSEDSVDVELHGASARE
jgi:hypothetical protein